jgi:hypothetical protein
VVAPPAVVVHVVAQTGPPMLPVVPAAVGVLISVSVSVSVPVSVAAMAMRAAR